MRHLLKLFLNVVYSDALQFLKEAQGFEDFHVDVVGLKICKRVEVVHEKHGEVRGVEVMKAVEFERRQLEINHHEGTVEEKR